MKKIVVIISILLVQLWGLAQESTLPTSIIPCDKVQVNDVKIEKVDKELIVTFNVTPAKNAVKSNYKMTLIPYLYNNIDTVALAQISVVGKQWARKEKQERLLAGIESEPTDQIIATGQPSAYRISMPYKKWMDKLSLRLTQTVEGCCKANLIGNENLANVVLRIPPKEYTITPKVSYITPEAEAVKTRWESGSAYLEFPVGKSTLLPGFRNNVSELAKIHHSIEVVKNDPDAKITRIELTGCCSPEGSWTSNTKLAKDRASVVCTYLKRTYHYDNKIFKVNSIPEDWKTLVQLVENSNMPWADDAATIINSAADPDVKDKQLANLDHGIPYKYMLADFYPKLRRVDYRVDYTVRKFTLEEAKEVIKTRPYNLSVKEMYLIAESYPKDSKEYNDIFEIAAKTFPQDETVNTNAAAILIGKGDLATAKWYLARSGNSPAANNNRAVVLMLEGKYAEATQLLEKVVSDGFPQAQANLEQVKAKVANTEQWREYNLITE